ncbi:MAG: DUF3800 domain-containing protein [Chthonomonadaceae bacterium]|nr:DUF3800 domain-containing protein [Chthonomonadaceae bacterium]
MIRSLGVAMAKQDPEGKRQARARAHAAEEALTLLAVARNRLFAIGDSELESAIGNLRRDLRRTFEADSGRSGGHLEPRVKYKGRSQHLALERGRGVITLYLDESGKPEPSLEQPLFVLAGVAMDEDASADYVRRADLLKDRFGISKDVSLHAPQIEKGLDDFAFGGDQQKLNTFQQAIAELVRDSSFRLLGSVIRKDALSATIRAGEDYLNLPPGLYEMALTFVAERLVDMLHSDQELKPCGRLVFESIGNREDAEHQRAFADLLLLGSEFVSDGCFRGWLQPGCEFRSKGGSHPLELADLAARALLTWARDGRPDEHSFWDLWAHRITTRQDVERGKFGVKVFPDADIRDEIIRIRERCRDKKGEA